MKLTIQDYGTSILIFIQGNTPEEAYGKWLSLYNWNATSTETNWITDRVISCWSTMEKLNQYFFTLRIGELMRNQSRKFKGQKGGFAKIARDLAAQDMAQVERESFRSVNENVFPYEIGVICAERPDDDFRDSLVNFAFSQKNLELQLQKA